MAKILINAVILMSILQLAGLHVPATASDWNGKGASVQDRVRAARERGVPEKVLTDLLARAVDRGLDPDRVYSLLGLLVDIRREGLPLAAFLAKVDEALAKGVNPAQLEARLRDRMADYRFVMRVLEQKYPRERVSEGPELSAVVDCLDIGLSREELTDFLRRAPATSLMVLAIAVQNKAFLQQIGFDPELCDELLRYGMAQGYLTNRWAGLFKAAAAAAKKGVSEKRFADAVKQVWTVRGDPHQLLETLGFTTRDVRRGPGAGPKPEMFPEVR
jgi:hypothetical protein